MWYLIKKKSESRWKVYNLDSKPELKRGYEFKGPYDNLIQCMIKCNDERDKFKFKK
jgi:hypothetical protein